MTLLGMKALRGKGMMGLLSMPFRLSKSIWQARRFFKKNQVDVAVSLGGFVAAPGGFATRLCATRLVVHEQNSVFGMTNKHLAKHAARVLTGFDLNGLYGSVWVGNPVRQQIEDLVMKTEASTPLRVLVLGGSLGAQSLNQIMPKVMKTHVEQGLVEIKHQCGRNKLADTQSVYGAMKAKVEVTEFITNMAKAYAWADVCVCRAGALTLAEITAAGLPAVLVPYPHAVDDHQTHNAMSLVNHHAALLWQEQEGSDALKPLVTQLLDAERRQAMQKALAQLKKHHVAGAIGDHCLEVAA